MLFVIRDRGSGYFVAPGSGPGCAWTMQRDVTFAIIVVAPDAQDRDLLKGIAAVSEWFGENARNGFDLRPVPLAFFSAPEFAWCKRD